MNKMKKLLILALSVFALQTQIQAQIGISGSYTQWHTPEWSNFIEDELGTSFSEAFYKNGYKIGADYWFRLPNVRVEFHPELAFSKVNADWSNLSSDLPNFMLQTQSYHFQLNTNFYIFDFFGDCDCPTWSKTEPFFKKGFFVQVSPGFTRQEHQIESIEESGKIETATNNTFNLAAGIGMDIGVSDYFTLTPFVKGWYFFTTDWQDFKETSPFNFPINDEDLSGSAPTNHFWLEAGMRIGFRWRH